jgi:hypothetical protein
MASKDDIKAVNGEFFKPRYSNHGFKLCWQGKSFGEITFIENKNGDVYIDTETMGLDFLMEALRQYFEGDQSNSADLIDNT